MSDSIKKDVKFSLKAVTDKQRTKVLFAEIDRDFADVLFSFLALPLGKIVRVLEKHYGDKAPAFGSMPTLYGSLSNLDGTLFWVEGWKEMLLDPVSSFSAECRKLKLDIADTQPTKYFICQDINCGKKCFGMYHDTFKCDCGKQMTKEIFVRKRAAAATTDGDDDGVFAISTSAFILSDDFEILPNATASVRKIVSDLGLIDANGTEYRNLTFGFNEIMNLLLFSLLVPSPLTCLILRKQMTHGPVQFQMEKIETSAHFCEVKVVLQKSTIKLLFVEAEEDFVDFLFSLLVLPLGKVESLLGGNTCLKNIDNLYRSIAFPIDSKYLRNLERTKLVNPTMPHGCVSRNRMFPLCEEVAPQLYYFCYLHPTEEYLSDVSYPLQTIQEYRVSELPHWVTVRRCVGSYVRGPSKFMVKDDLTVIPFSTTSYLSTINEQKIPFSDVDELVLKIGLQEASCILKASLTSSCALSNGLSHLLMKQPKPERVVKQEQYY